MMSLADENLEFSPTFLGRTHHTLSLLLHTLRAFFHPSTSQERTVRAAFLSSVSSNSLFYLGLASFIYGAWLMWHPAGWMVGGVLGVGVSVLIDREQAREELNRVGRQMEDEHFSPMRDRARFQSSR
jgi:hypothetical protein